jgi:hypothetical protein
MSLTDYGVRGILLSMLAETPMSDQLLQLAFQFESDLPAGKSEDLSFLGAIGVLKEWGEAGRNITQPKEYDFTLRNLKFSGGVRIPNDWAENDKTGQVRDKLGDLVKRRSQFWSKRLAALINVGETSTKTIDGVAFFADAHAKYSSFDNLLTYAAASGVAPTPLEAANAIYAAYIAMLGYLDDQGEPANEGLSKLVITCGTDIGASVMQAVTQDILDTGAGTKDNPLKSMRAAGISLSAVVTPRISTTAKMQVWNASPNAKPLLIQRNSKGSKLSMKGAGSEFEHDNDSWEYALKEVGETGFGRPWEANQTEFT